MQAVLRRIDVVRAIDVARFAFGAALGNRLRTLLSMLAMSIGVAAVVVLTALGDGARHYVIDQFSSLGTNLVIVLPGRTQTGGFSPANVITGTPRDLTVEDAKAVTRATAVRRVAPVVVGTSEISAGGRLREALVLGTTTEYLSLRSFTMAQGHFLPEEDWGRGSPVIVLGAKMRADLFGSEPALGQFVRIGDRRFRVIGILGSSGTGLGMNTDELAIVPVATAQQMFNTNSLFRILVEALLPLGIVQRHLAGQLVAELVALGREQRHTTQVEHRQHAVRLPLRVDQERGAGVELGVVGAEGPGDEARNALAIDKEPAGGRLPLAFEARADAATFELHVGDHLVGGQAEFAEVGDQYGVEALVQRDVSGTGNKVRAIARPVDQRYLVVDVRNVEADPFVGHGEVAGIGDRRRTRIEHKRDHLVGRNRVDLTVDGGVEIGCNTTIDRGSLGTTRIGQGTKIDNLVQVAHNVSIGENCLLVPPGDAAALGASIGRLRSDQVLAERMGRAARETVTRHFGLDRIGQGTLGLARLGLSLWAERTGKRAA